MPDYDQTTRKNKSNSKTHTPLNKLSYPEDKTNKQQDPEALGRFLAAPFSASVQDYLSANSIMGNSVMNHVIQAKLSLRPAGDHYEQEADKVAKEVVNPAFSRHKVKLEHPTAWKPGFPSLPSISRQVKTPTASSRPGEGSAVAEELERQLNSTRGGGKPLPHDTRSFMESRFGADFSKVRVHTSDQAVQLNRKLQAEAFTHGKDIYMAEGRYQPQSKAGQELMAHELTHVVQQDGQVGMQSSGVVQCNKKIPGFLDKFFKKKTDKEKQPDTTFNPEPGQQQPAAPAQKQIAPYVDFDFKNRPPGQQQPAAPAQKQPPIYVDFDFKNRPPGQPLNTQQSGSASTYTPATQEKWAGASPKNVPQPPPSLIGMNRSKPAKPSAMLKTGVPPVGMKNMKPALTTLPKLSEYDDEELGVDGDTPTYYQPDNQPNPYGLEIQGGKLMQGGKAMDTGGTPQQFIKDKANRHMFTLGSKGELHSADVAKETGIHGKVHHTTMGGGKDVAAAGDLKVDKGKLDTVGDDSGHYKPGTAMTYQALKHFSSKGVDLSATGVELTGKGEGQKKLGLSATEMMAYKPEMEAAMAKAQLYRQSHSLDRSSGNAAREEHENKMREILSEPEQKIRLEHSKKDLMLQELKGKTKDKKKELDQAAPEAQGTKKLQGFAYEEQLRALKGAEITAWQNYENAKWAREEFQQQNALGKP